MRDGAHLVATVYKPSKMERPLPVIFMLDPYGAGRYGEEGRWYAARGYVFAHVDVRGCGDSPGTFRPFETEARDGYDTAEWLARQPYSKGKIGMFGGSYQGWVQWAVLKEFPPHLKTIIPGVSTLPGKEGIPKNRNIYLPYVMSWLHQLERNSGRPISRHAGLLPKIRAT
jgi:putative CocE/NonD family hydrolase